MMALMLFAYMQVVAGDSIGGTLVTGRVVDAEGEGLGGALVTARHEASGAAFTTLTDYSGAYHFAGLASGSYSVRFELLGFVGLTRTPVAISERSGTLDAMLSVVPLTLEAKQLGAPEK